MLDTADLLFKGTVVAVLKQVVIVSCLSELLKMLVITLTRYIFSGWWITWMPTGPAALLIFTLSSISLISAVVPDS